jgi:hypothetical protein
MALMKGLGEPIKGERNAPGFPVPADRDRLLDISILGQLAPAQLPLGDGLEPGPLEVVRLNASFGVVRSGSSR